jgi:GGDEF domain-containing protein
MGRSSIGTATVPADELIAEGDRTMYAAKQGGRTARRESLAVH